MVDVNLSKTKFMGGLQCSKRLFLECHNSELADPIDPGQQGLFDAARAVAEQARKLYPGGWLIQTDYVRHSEAVEATREAVADHSVPAIYDACFTFGKINFRVNILNRIEADRFELIEVKSSTQVKPEEPGRV